MLIIIYVVNLLQEEKVFKELVLSNTAKGLLHVFLAERASSKVSMLVYYAIDSAFHCLIKNGQKNWNCF